MTATLLQDFTGEYSDNTSEEGEIISLYKECHDFAYRSWGTYLDEATKDLAFVLGQQWDAQDKAYLKEQRRNALVFNKIRRNIKMVTGFERKSRVALIAKPVEGSDEMTAEEFTELLLWAQNYDNMHHTISDAFENGPLKTGINLCELTKDLFEDPVNGDMRLLRHPYNAFLLDPRLSKRDLSDCEYVIVRKLYSRETVKALLPFKANEIDHLTVKGEDLRFPHMTQFFDSRGRQTLRYDSFWRRIYKPVKMLVDMRTGKTQEIDKRTINDERFRIFMQAFGDQVKVIDKQVPTVEQNIIVEDRLMFRKEDPLKIGDFPFIPFWGFWEPEYSDDSGNSDFALKLQSLVRPGRDPQTETNKRRSKLLDIIDTQVSSGWIAENGSVRNPRSLHRSGQGSVIWYESGRTPPQKIPPADIPGNVLAFMEVMDKDVVESMGVTDELLGDPTRDNVEISGILSKLRQGAGLTVLQDLFDNANLSKQMLGKKMIKFIQNNWGAEKVARILNKQPSQEFYKQTFGKYDVVVEEAQDTPSQRALAYTQAVQARQIGVNIPDSFILDLMPIQKKSDLKEALKAQEQQAARQAQEQMKDQEILRNFQKAKSFNEIALGVERIARSEADKGLAKERISELQENNAQAALARAKTIREIQQMDDDRLMGLYEFLERVKLQNVQENQAIDQQQQNEVQSDFVNVRKLIGINDVDANNMGFEPSSNGMQL